MIGIPRRNGWRGRARPAVALALALALGSGGGCTLARVQVDVVSERTALENQILGSYNALDAEMHLVASVRGVDSSGRIREPPPRSREARDATLALQVMAFHEDDVAAFKRLGWAGEGFDGLLAAFPAERGAAPSDLEDFAARTSEEELRAVLTEVNRAREAVMERIVQINEDLTPEDLPMVRRVFGRLNAEGALPGERVQLDDGTWTEKP
ncbi:MAG: DUF1318 domain-containing protein [Deferrisomatales bacterium]|nr:DUF1318 domain-containing protein [Deferrisomatales bacterium]